MWIFKGKSLIWDSVSTSCPKFGPKRGFSKENPWFETASRRAVQNSIQNVDFQRKIINLRQRLDELSKIRSKPWIFQEKSLIWDSVSTRTRSERTWLSKKSRQFGHFSLKNQNSCSEIAFWRTNRDVSLENSRFPTAFWQSVQKSRPIAACPRKFAENSIFHMQLFDSKLFPPCCGLWGSSSSGIRSLCFEYFFGCRVCFVLTL